MPNFRALYPGGYFSSTPYDRSTGPVSIRMNNPGAINGAKWEEAIPGFLETRETTPGNKTTVFEHPEGGIIAWHTLVMKHYRKRNLTTIRQIINQYGGGQDYSTYWKVVSQRTGFPQDKVITDDDAVLLPFAKAMFHYEAGRQIPWKDEQILFGFQLARMYHDTGSIPSDPKPSAQISAPPKPAGASVPTVPLARSWMQSLLDLLGGPRPSPQRPGAPAIVPGAGARPFLRDGMAIADIQAVQQWHIDAGILDPLADGKAGPLTKWSLSMPVPKPIRLVTGELASKIARVFVENHWWLCLVPDVPNLGYVEGMNLDGTYNPNDPNRFNDVRFDLRFKSDGAPYLHSMYRATTEPGKYWTEHRMNPGGAFRIAFGQKKAWTHGTYNGMLAARQAAEISGFRDDNEDFQRQGDVMVTGDNYGVHHHGGYNYPVDDLGRSSAGCLVVRSMTEHDKSMRDLRADPRYRAAGANYRIISTVFPYAAFGSDSGWKKFIA